MTSALRWGWVVSTTSRPLYPRERPGTHCTGGWVGPRAVLDGCGKSHPHRDSIPRLSSPQQVDILTELSWPMKHIYIYILQIIRKASTNLWSGCLSDIPVCCAILHMTVSTCEETTSVDEFVAFSSEFLFWLEPWFWQMFAISSLQQLDHTSKTQKNEYRNYYCTYWNT